MSARNDLDIMTEDQPVDWLYLPPAVTHALRDAGIDTVGALTMTALRQLCRCQHLRRLSQHDWVVLVRMLRRSLAYAAPRPRSRSGAAVGRPLSTLGLPASAERALERCGITHLGELTTWTLGDLLALKDIGASGVASIARSLVGSLPDQLRLDSGSGEAAVPGADDADESDAHARHRDRPRLWPRRPDTDGA